MNSTYAPPFQLSIPGKLMADTRLNFIDKALWAHLATLQGKSEEKSNEALAELFDLAPKYVKNVKTRLARLGYLQRQTISKGAFRLVPVDPAVVAMEKIRRFLSVSKVFGGLTALDLLSLRPDAERVLYTMEVLEWAYRGSKKPVEKPLHLLRAKLKAGVREDRGFVSLWWEKEIAAKETAEAAKKNEENDRALQRRLDREAAARAKELDKMIEELPTVERAQLSSQARANLLANGWTPGMISDASILRESRQIMEGRA